MDAVFASNNQYNSHNTDYSIGYVASAMQIYTDTIHQTSRNRMYADGNVFSKNPIDHSYDLNLVPEYNKLIDK